MKKIFYLFTLMLMCACTQSDDGILYGNKLKLENSRWICTDIAKVDGGLLPKADYKLSFQNDGFIFKAVEEAGLQDTAYTLQGRYTYDHPHLLLISGQDTIAAWINPQDRISFIGGLFAPRVHEFQLEK